MDGIDTPEVLGNVGRKKKAAEATAFLKRRSKPTRDASRPPCNWSCRGDWWIFWSLSRPGRSKTILSDLMIEKGLARAKPRGTTTSLVLSFLINTISALGGCFKHPTSATETTWIRGRHG